MSWLHRLQSKWKLNSIYQVIIILIVFACTGFTVLFLKRPLFSYWFGDGAMPIWSTLLYYLLILPVYNFFLLLYGFVFGQFTFFWAFEKRMLTRIIAILLRTK